MQSISGEIRTADYSKKISVTDREELKQLECEAMRTALRNLSLF